MHSCTLYIRTENTIDIMSDLNVNALLFSVLYLGLVIIVLALAYYFSLKINRREIEGTGLPRETDTPIPQEPVYSEVTQIDNGSRTVKNDPESVTYAVINKPKKNKKSKKEYFPEVPAQDMELTEYATVRY